jgi:hypothetical protein
MKLDDEIWSLENFKIPDETLETQRHAVKRAISEKLNGLYRQRHQRDNACEKCGGFGFSCYCGGV